MSATEAETVYRTNPDLPDGDENVLVKGMDGKVVDTLLEVQYEDEMVTKDLGRSVYNPLNTLIEISEKWKISKGIICDGSLLDHKKNMMPIFLKID